MGNRVRLDGDTAFVQLRRQSGPPLEAIVDGDAIPLLRGHTWSALKSRNGHYAKTTVTRCGRDQTVYLHRHLCKAGEDVQVRHLDGNGLNCGRENLQIVPRRRSYKAHNEPMTESSNSAPGIKGVRRLRDGRYAASIPFDGQRLSLGAFGNEAEAVRALGELRDLVRQHIREVVARQQPRLRRRSARSRRPFVRTPRQNSE